MHVVISRLYNGFADEVKLMRPGTSMVENYAFVDATQRDEIPSYLSGPEEGSKWNLWPCVIDDSTIVGKKTSQMKQSPKIMKKTFFKPLIGQQN